MSPPNQSPTRTTECHRTDSEESQSPTKSKTNGRMRANSVSVVREALFQSPSKSKSTNQSRVDSNTVVRQKLDMSPSASETFLHSEQYPRQGIPLAGFSTDPGACYRDLTIERAKERNHDHYFMGLLTLGKKYSDPQLKNKIHDAFTEVHDEVKRHLKIYDENIHGSTGNDEESGCTALVCLIQEQRIVIANAGDSKAVLVYKNPTGVYELKDLTAAHRVTSEGEKKRIDELPGTYRTNERLCTAAVRKTGIIPTRGLGAAAYEPGFTAEPEIIIVDKTQLKDAFVVMSTDGFWEAMDDQALLDFFNNPNNQHLSITEKTNHLVNQAITNGSKDNITVGICSEGFSGVFDGFGPLGGIAARAAAQYLPQILTESMFNDHQSHIQITSHFDSQQRAQILSENLQSLETGVACVSLTKEITVCKKGTARATLVYKKQGQYIAQSLVNNDDAAYVLNYDESLINAHKYLVIHFHDISPQDIMDALNHESLSNIKDTMTLTINGGLVKIFKILPNQLIVAAEDENYNIPNLLISIYQGIIEKYFNFKTGQSSLLLDKLKNTLLSNNPNNMMPWDARMMLAKDTQNIIDNPSIENMQIYYDKYVSLRKKLAWRVLYLIVFIVISGLVGAIVGGAIGWAAAQGTFWSAKLLAGAIEGIVKAIALASGLAIIDLVSTGLTSSRLNYSYTHLFRGKEATAQAAIADWNSYPAFCP